MSLTIVSPLTEEDIKFINFAVEVLAKGNYPSFEKVTDTHNRLFGQNLKQTHCAKCIRDRVSQLKNLVDENEKGNVVVGEIKVEQEKPVEEKPKKEKTKRKRVVKKVIIDEDTKSIEDVKVQVLSVQEPIMLLANNSGVDCDLPKHICYSVNNEGCADGKYKWTYLIYDDNKEDKYQGVNYWTINGFTYKPVDVMLEEETYESDGNPVKYLNNFAENNNMLTSVNLNSFDTTNVISWAYAFSRCTRLQSVTLPKCSDDDYPEILTGMFCGCYNLKYVDLGNMMPDNIKKANNMFKNCDEPITIICNGEMQTWIKENYEILGLNNDFKFTIG